jgi:hypothetical protein
VQIPHYASLKLAEYHDKKMNYHGMPGNIDVLGCNRDRRNRESWHVADFKLFSHELTAILLLE